jgi:hypothetical protein
MNKPKKPSRRDLVNIYEAFNRKVEEYSKMDLDTLKALYPSLRGTYREACIEVVAEKLAEQRAKDMEEIDHTKVVTEVKESISEMTIDNTEADEQQ